jgi:TonB family protein
MKVNLSKFALILFLTLFCGSTSNAQEGDNSNKSSDQTQKSDQEQNESKDCPASGTAKLEVTFDKSGKVTKAEIVSSAGCKSFDEQALKAAKSIKFEPAKKHGKKITKVKIVEYTFSSND